MFAVLLTAVLGATVASATSPDGSRLQPGVSCYEITSGERVVGTTLQIVTPTEEQGKLLWDIVVHQKAGAFDLRDHFIVDRSSLLPVRMESQRGRDPSDRRYHRISISYDEGRIYGVRETAEGTTAINTPAPGPVWDGNLWGLTFAALPLENGSTYTIPFWQYDKGFGTFIVRVIGSEDVSTSSGPVAAWVVEAGDRPDALIRYSIAKDTRQELGYTAPEGGQRLGGMCP